MRLHNRQIKATFWNDPDLLQWQRDKRWFYEGLWQLADDSGCLEDNPFAFKVNLFPSPLDADLTVEALAGWRDELLEQGKLIRYEVTGKQYLFMVNFHKHQTLDKPTPPSKASIPLPPCVEWVEVTNDKGQVSRRQSRYVVKSEVLERYWTNSGQWPDNVRTSPGLAPVEPELELEPELDLNDDDNGPARPNFVTTYEQEFGRLISPTDMQQLGSYITDGVEEEVVCEAIRRARAQNVLKVSYVRSIMNTWKTEGVINMAGVARADLEFEQRKARDGPRGGQAREPTSKKPPSRYAHLAK